jgi:hypothetical protein
LTPIERNALGQLTVFAGDFDASASVPLAMVFFDLGLHGRALDALERARDLATRSGLARGEALIWTYTGLVRLAQGEVADARVRLDRAIELESRIHNRLHESFARGIRAAARATADDVAGAVEDLRIAELLAGDDGSRRWLQRPRTAARSRRRRARAGHSSSRTTPRGS